jgi:uncharacterized protein YkwD
MKKFTAILVAGVFSVFGSQSLASDICATPANVDAMANEIARGLNASRAAHGKSQLDFNRKLGQAAMAHACDMSVNNFFGHQGTDGSNSQRRVRAAGYQDCLVAENLAWGYPRSEQIINGWMNSAGHRSNMLHPRAQEFGIGITVGEKGPNWVLVLAKGC